MSELHALGNMNPFEYPKPIGLREIFNGVPFSFIIPFPSRYLASY